MTASLPWDAHRTEFNRGWLPVMIILLVVSLEILQEINTMKLIWAFKFSKSKDPATKQDKVYDLDDLVTLLTRAI